MPPDLTQLARDARYQPQGGVVSAARRRQHRGAGPLASTAAAPATMTQTVAPIARGDMRIERQGTQRWLVVPMTPEQLWPQLQGVLAGARLHARDRQPETGVMETDWAENRAKLPQDWHPQRAWASVLDWHVRHRRARPVPHPRRTHAPPAARSTSATAAWWRSTPDERAGTTTMWQPRPSDPQLEAEFLSRLMVKLGARRRQARTAAATHGRGRGRGRRRPRRRRAPGRCPAGAATLEVDDGFDRAWRRVGLALDRSGFTVEDRDRAAGLYFVRYVDPANAGKEEPSFFDKMFGKDSKPVAPHSLPRAGQGDAAERARSRCSTQAAHPTRATTRAASSACC